VRAKRIEEVLKPEAAPSRPPILITQRKPSARPSPTARLGRRMARKPDEPEPRSTSWASRVEPTKLH
jgi:hypothetical protein